MASSPEHPVLCIVGAGTAGLEALLAAREQLGPGAQLRLIAPDGQFRYRPMSPDSPFRPAAERSLDVAQLVQAVGGAWFADRADLIDQSARTVLTRDGATVSYDHLLLAAGTRSERSLRQGCVWERGADPGFLDSILADIAAGQVRSVALVVPRGARWPLPAYELALVLAWSAAATGARTAVTLVSVEERPLGALGPHATAAVAAELSEAGVEVLTGVEALEHALDAEGQDVEARPARITLVPEAAGSARDPLRHGAVDRSGIGEGRELQFDRLISLPTISGPYLSGIPTDAAGFIEVDQGLKVCGTRRIWAAGGCVAAALEHSALSAGQADAVAAAIAAALGVGTQAPPPPELTGMLLRGQRERWLAENPPGTRQPSTRCLWWPPGRAVGRMLARHIAALDTDVSPDLPSIAAGVPVQVPVALGCADGTPAAGAGGAPSAGGTPGAGGAPSAEDRAARLRDVEQRQLMALTRQERSADAELREMSARLQTLQARQDRAVRDLHRHGYLQGRD